MRPLRLTGTVLPDGTAQLPESLVHGYQVAAGQATDVTSQYRLFGPELGGAAGGMVSTLGDLELWAYALGHPGSGTPGDQPGTGRGTAGAGCGGHTHSRNDQNRKAAPSPVPAISAPS